MRRKPSGRPTERRLKPWSVRMEGYGGPAQPSPTIGQCLYGGLGWLEVECARCKTRASLPLDAIRRPKRYAALETGSFPQMPVLPHPRYAPPARILKLTETRQITPYKWVHPTEER